MVTPSARYTAFVCTAPSSRDFTNNASKYRMGVDGCQGPRLPGTHLVEHRIRNGRNEGRGDLCPVQLFQMPLALPRGEAAGIQAQHLGIEALQTPLTFGDEPRDKAAVTVARDRNI